MTPDIERCFLILGVDGRSSFEGIKLAYRDSIRAWHPDRFQNDPAFQQRAQEKLKEVNLAYEKLSALYAMAESEARSRNQHPLGPPQRPRLRLPSYTRWG